MASPVVYFVRRGHLPNTRFLLFAAAALWGCGSRAPGVVSSQPQTPHQVSQAQIQARTPPAWTAVEGVLKGKLPAVDRVVGLDPESEFLFVTTAKRDLLSLDLGSGRVDTVAENVGR